jgi:uncharacterized protein with PIN domain
MLKGLTRWLRAGGYDASWTYGIEDDTLVRNAFDENRVLLTSDSGIMKKQAVQKRNAFVLFIPRNLSVPKQVEFVFKHFALKRREPRCMKCGGSLAWIPKASVRSEAPPRTYSWLDDFYRCLRCAQLFWKGTHWNNILDQLNSFIPNHTLKK